MNKFIFLALASFGLMSVAQDGLVGKNPKITIEINATQKGSGDSVSVELRDAKADVSAASGGLQMVEFSNMAIESVGGNTFEVEIDSAAITDQLDKITFQVTSPEGGCDHEFSIGKGDLVDGMTFVESIEIDTEESCAGAENFYCKITNPTPKRWKWFGARKEKCFESFTWDDNNPDCKEVSEAVENLVAEMGCVKATFEEGGFVDQPGPFDINELCEGTCPEPVDGGIQEECISGKLLHTNPGGSSPIKKKTNSDGKTYYCYTGYPNDYMQLAPFGCNCCDLSQ